VIRESRCPGTVATYAFDVRLIIAMRDTAKGLALSANLTSIRRKREQRTFHWRSVVPRFD
jgi:hypothetical protein